MEEGITFISEDKKNVLSYGRIIRLDSEKGKVFCFEGQNKNKIKNGYGKYHDGNGKIIEAGYYEENKLIN